MEDGLRDRQPESEDNHHSRRSTMNAFLSLLYRDLTCAAAAAVISLIVAASFVQSTNVPPGTTAATAAVTVLPGLKA
jgi:hypothetical protein